MLQKGKARLRQAALSGDVLFYKVGPLEMQQNLWPYLWAPISVIINRKRKYQYMMIIQDMVYKPYDVLSFCNQWKNL